MMFTLLHRSRNHCKTLLWEEKPRAWNKSVHTSKFHGDLPPIGKIDHRFCRKSTTSSTDFRESVTFGDICHKCCEAPFLGRTCSVFGENRLRFWEEQAPFLGQSVSILVKTGTVWWINWLGFWIGLDKAQVSLFWMQSMFGFGFRDLKVGGCL